MKIVFGDDVAWRTETSVIHVTFLEKSTYERIVFALASADLTRFEQSVVMSHPLWAAAMGSSE